MTNELNNNGLLPPPIALLERRRAMMIKKQELIEKPDCIRIDFSTSSDNTTVRVGYFLYSSIEYAELDGARAKVSGTESTVITVPAAGAHIIYIKLKSSGYPSNYAFRFPRSCNYFRFPYNMSQLAKGAIYTGQWGVKWSQIDILDNRVLWQVKNNVYGTFSGADIIRVPIGTKQLYANYGTSQSILNKMVEYNFKYMT